MAARADRGWVYGYEKAGNKVSPPDALGRETTWTYDAHGRQRTGTPRVGRTETAAYPTSMAAIMTTHMHYRFGIERHTRCRTLRKTIAFFIAMAALAVVSLPFIVSTPKDGPRIPYRMDAEQYYSIAASASAADIAIWTYWRRAGRLPDTQSDGAFPSNILDPSDWDMPDEHGGVIRNVMPPVDPTRNDPAHSWVFNASFPERGIVSLRGGGVRYIRLDMCTYAIVLNGPDGDEDVKIAEFDKATDAMDGVASDTLSTYSCIGTGAIADSGDWIKIRNVCDLVSP